MKAEGVDFPGAMEILADMAGIEYHRHQPSGGNYSSYGAHNHFESTRHFDPSEALPEEEAYEPEIPPELIKTTSAQPPLAASVPEGAEPISALTPDQPDFTSPEPALPAVPEKKSTPRQTLFKTLSWVERQYNESLLFDPQGERARAYLEKRGITPESIEKFKLGYCPEPQNWLVNKVNNVPRRIRLLTEVGILSAGYSGMYDRFRDRVMFPIHNPMGQCVAFGGRMMDDTTVVSKAKYINSPETSLFSKRKQLYGLDLAKKTISKSRRVLVMEGYMDCIVAHQFGFTDAVAVLGTALGTKHIETLRHYVDTVVLILDGDAAGQKRTGEVLELFVSQNVDLQVVTLPAEPGPDGTIPKDPAEYLLAWGAQAFENLIQTQAKDALKHAVDFYTKGVDLSDIHASNQALQKILELFAQIPQTSLQDAKRGTEVLFREHQIILKLALLFRTSEEYITKRIKEIRQEQSRSRFRREYDDPDDADSESEEDSTAQSVTSILSGNFPAQWGTESPSERELFELVLNYPQIWYSVREKVNAGDLRFLPAAQSYQLIQLWTDQGKEFTPQFLLDNLIDPRMKAWVELRMKSGSLNPVADPISSLDELLVNFRNVRIDQQKNEILGQLEESGNKKMDIPWTQILKDLRTRHGIDEPTDGNDRDVNSEDPPF